LNIGLMVKAAFLGTLAIIRLSEECDRFPSQ
jgi:hypothetical protein